MRTSREITSAPPGSLRPGLMLAVVAGCWLLPAAPARAVIVVYYYDSSTNAAISFGASPLTGTSGSPTWAYNSLTGLSDILASAGGGFPVANPVSGNDVASAGPASLVGYSDDLFLHTSGGTAPLSGATFGTGWGGIFGDDAAMYLADSGGVGTASYGIATWTANYSQNVNISDYMGTYLSVGGSVPVAGSFAIAAIQAEVAVTGPNGGTTNDTLAPLIVAVENLGGGNFATFALSSNNNAESGAFLYVDPKTGQFWAYVDDALTTSQVAAGSTIAVTSTMTFYGDPASIQTIDPDTSLFPSLFVPQESFNYTTFVPAGVLVPEPGSMVMGGTAVIALSMVGWMRRRARRAA